MLFMPIYFVLGQHDVQSPSRHDSEGSTDLLRGEGTLKKTFVFEVWKQDQNFLSLAPEFGIGQNKKQVIRILDIYCTKYQVALSIYWNTK